MVNEEEEEEKRPLRTLHNIWLYQVEKIPFGTKTLFSTLFMVNFFKIHLNFVLHFCLNISTTPRHDFECNSLINQIHPYRTSIIGVVYSLKEFHFKWSRLTTRPRTVAQSDPAAATAANSTTAVLPCRPRANTPRRPRWNPRELWTSTRTLINT